MVKVEHYVSKIFVSSRTLKLYRYVVEQDFSAVLLILEALSYKSSHIFCTLTPLKRIKCEQA